MNGLRFLIYKMYDFSKSFFFGYFFVGNWFLPDSVNSLSCSLSVELVLILS